MDRIVDLTMTVQSEVKGYARPALLATTYYFENPAQRAYVVLLVPDPEARRKIDSGIIVMARVVTDASGVEWVVIDEDTTDRPLWRELVRVGIPRNQIICAYAGEKLPEPQP